MPAIVCFNGSLVPESEAKVSVFDRAYLYGDGLFETLLVFSGRPFRLSQHLHRLREGASAIGLALPFRDDQVSDVLSRLVLMNRLPESVARIHVSRGVGQRGMSVAGAPAPNWVISLHPSASGNDERPPQCRLRSVADFNASSLSIGTLKSCSRLPYILAREQALRQGADEALLVGRDGKVLETDSGNVFVIQAGRLRTPPADRGVLAGITRGVLLEISPAVAEAARVGPLRLEDSSEWEGMFVTSSGRGVVEVLEVDGRGVSRSPLTGRLWEEYWRTVRRECASAASPAG